MEPAQLPTPDPVPAELPPPSPLNRAAMTRDVGALLAWARTSARWTLIDRMVKFLPGPSLEQRSSHIWSAVMALSDDELGALLEGVLSRAAGYLGLAPAPDGVDPAELAAAERLAAILRGDPR
jgi:hypothetical protein